MKGTVFGWGDVLIVLGMIPLFEPIGFLITLQLSALFSIGWALFRKNKTDIPFAGVVSLVCLLFLGLKYSTPYNLLTDEVFLF